MKCQVTLSEINIIFLYPWVRNSGIHTGWRTSYSHRLSYIIIKACTSILCQKTILSFGSNIHACASSQELTHDTYFLLPNDGVSMAWYAAKASNPSTDRNVGFSFSSELFRLLGSRFHSFQIVVDIQYYSMVGERRVFRNHHLAIHQLGEIFLIMVRQNTVITQHWPQIPP